MLAGLLGILTTALPAAAQSADWAEWEPLEGSAGNFSTTMQLQAGGFPAAQMQSDSRGGVGVISGASNWLSENTPPGMIYGSSEDMQYVNLRPQADNADSPSTTTYTFDRPTPASGWAFVLGDIDADEVTVSARGPDGQPLSAAELGFEGTFNYCDVAGSPSCTGNGDVPTWDPGTMTLTGNAAAADTSGAAGWFQPSVPIKTLTFTFRWRSGFPVYQTWFASLAHDITGTVTGPTECVEGSTINLFAPDGALVASTAPDADGTYEFLGYTAADGYEVEILPPDSCLMDESAPPPTNQQRQQADLSGGNATDVDFALREIVPVAVNGTVTDTDGNPVPGVEVEIALDGGGTLTATTDSNGFYVFDTVPAGDHTIDIPNPPDGYTIDSQPGPLTVPEDSEEPITEQDFILAPNPSLSGTVTAGGSPVGGVLVSIDGPSGPMSTLTNADGTYEFDRLEPGDYTITVEPPDGYVVDGPDTLTPTVADDDVSDQDFALARLGALGGTVTDADGNPLGGVTVIVSGPDGEHALTTDAEGGYFLGELEPGDYTAMIVVPEGAMIDGPEVLSATITAAGERVLDLDFTLAPEEQPPDEPDGPDQPDQPELPKSGAAVMSAAAIGALLLLVGGGAALVARNRKH